MNKKDWEKKELVRQKVSDLKDTSLLIERTYQLPSIMDEKSTHQGIGS